MSGTLSELMAEMAEAGAPMQAILAAVRFIENDRLKSEAKAEERRAADRKRKQEKKEETERQTTSTEFHGIPAEIHGTSTEANSATSREDIIPARADGNQTNPSLRSGLDITPLPSVGAPKGAKPKPKTEIVEALTAGGLSESTAADVVAHRKAKRSPLTPRGAAELAKQFAATGSPEEAAAMMISQGWTGFRLDWWENARSSARNGPSPPCAGPPKRPMSFLELELRDQALRAQNATDLEAYTDKPAGPILELAGPEWFNSG